MSETREHCVLTSTISACARAYSAAAAASDSPSSLWTIGDAGDAKGVLYLCRHVCVCMASEPALKYKKITKNWQTKSNNQGI